MKNFLKRELAEISQEKKATLKGSHYASPPPVGSHHSVKESSCEAKCLDKAMVTHRQVIGGELTPPLK